MARPVAFTKTKVRVNTGSVIVVDDIVEDEEMKAKEEQKRQQQKEQGSSASSSAAAAWRFLFFAADFDSGLEGASPGSFWACSCAERSQMVRGKGNRVQSPCQHGECDCRG
jgi:hypothetical protein